MTTKPLVTYQDIKDRYARLVRMSGVKSTSALDDIAKGAIGEIKKRLGYNPQVDSETGLASISERLNGGRPIVVLAAPVDRESEDATIEVKEFGTVLTERGNWPAPPTAQTGDYFVDDFTLYRLAGPGARTLGIWGANSNLGSIGGLSNPTVGGMRSTGDYTDSYRGVIEVTYTPDIDISLIKQVALNLCRFELLNIIASTSVRLGDAAQQIEMPADIPLARQAELSRLPTPLRLGTGS